MRLTEVALAVQGRIRRLFAVGILAAIMLGGCSGKERKNFEAGKALLNEGKYAEAVEAFDKAIEAHGSNSIRGLEIDILRYRAEAEYRAGDYKAAEHSYRLLTSADENRSEYMDMLAIIYTKLSNTDMDINIDDAIEMYERAAKQDDKSELHINAGITIVEYYEDMYDKKMDAAYLDSAEEFLEKLLKETGRKNAKVLAVYAKHMSKREDYDKALEAVDEGIVLLGKKKLNKNDDETLKSLMFSRGSCYEYKSDYNNALEAFNAYIEKYGEDESVSHEVAFLKARIR